MIRNIVFDMGNVLLYWDPMLPCLRHAGGDRELARKVCRATFEDPEWGRCVDGGLILENDYAEIAASRLDTPLEKAICRAAVADFDQDAVYPVRRTEKLVEELLDAGYALYMLSNTGGRFHKYKYKIRNLDRFRGVMISAEQHLLKPRVEIFRRMEEVYGLDPAETLFVDDLRSNLEGARAAGWQTFLYNTQDADGLRRLLGSGEAARPLE